MRLISHILKGIGFVVIVSTLIFSMQMGMDDPSGAVEKGPNTTGNEELRVSETYQISSIDIPEDLNFSGEIVPQDDPEIMERIDREFLVNTYWQSNAILLLKRAHKYFPIIEPILAEHNIPDDFKYLAVAESGLQNVVSSAGATGFWQFMKTTAREYGMEVNENVDERYHLEKSTEAACKYLQRSYKKYGSWTLAAASYNTGPGSLDRYRSTQDESDYYNLLLSEETGRYVFRILALKEILSDSEKYGFIVDEEDHYPAVPDYAITVDSPITNLANFAKYHEINYKILKRHNPWLRQAHLNNASRKVYQIAIPHKGHYTTIP
jgi:membrane-bound lytic murein transglycosylase D